MLPAQIELVEGKRVRVAHLGTGHPLVLLHGYPDNLQVWSAVAPLLHAEVIAFDWPGMGGSESWPGGATPFDMASRLIALLDHWKIERAAIAGLDMGGQPALVAAARYPDRISHLIVSGSLVQWDALTSWDIRLLRRFRFNELFMKHFPRIVFHRALSTFGATPPEDIRDDFWEHFQRPEVRDFIVRMCAGYQGTLPLLPKEYPRISAPTLILWGSNDRHFPPIQAERLQDQIRGSRLQIIEGGEHWLPLQKPREFATAVYDFTKE